MADDQSLAAASRDALEIFVSLTRLLETTSRDDNFRVRLADLLQRFKLWAGNIGALHEQTNQRSLEHRVANTPKLKARFTELLDDVLNDLAELELLSKELDAGPRSETSKLRVSFDDLIDTLNESINSLFTTSGIARRATTRDRYMLALNKIDASQVTGESDDFDIIGDLFPRLRLSAHDWLRGRLARANNIRRRYLRYCEEHQTSIESGVSKLRKTPSIESMEWDEARTEKSSQSARTTATTVNAAAYENVEAGRDDAESVFSYDTDSAIPIRYRVIELEEVNNGIDTFVCPYCKKELYCDSKNQWKTHVFSDIRAYVCLEQECEAKLFETSRSWLSHQLSAHLTKQVCPYCEEERRFDKLSQFQAHLRQSHGSKFNEEQLTQICQVGEQVPHSMSVSACPFCDWQTKLKARAPKRYSGLDIAVSLQRYRRHIGSHLEQAALAVLAVENPEELPLANVDNALDIAHDERPDWMTESDGDFSEDDPQDFNAENLDHDSLLIKFADESEDAAAGLASFRKGMPENAARITPIINELFAISSVLRRLRGGKGSQQFGPSFYRIRDNIELVFRTLSITLAQIFTMFGHSHEETEQTLWEEFNCSIEREEGYSLLERLASYRDFLDSQYDILQGRNAEDLSRLHYQLEGLLKVQKASQRRFQETAALGNITPWQHMSSRSSSPHLNKPVGPTLSSSRMEKLEPTDHPPTSPTATSDEQNNLDRLRLLAHETDQYNTQQHATNVNSLAQNEELTGDLTPVEKLEESDIGLLNQAVTFIARGDEFNGLRCCQKLETIQRESPSVFRQLAEIYITLGLPQRALEIYSRIEPPVTTEEKSRAVSIEAHITQARVALKGSRSGLVAAHELDKAEKLLGRGIRTPREWRLMRGEAYLRTGDMSNLRKTFDIAGSLISSGSEYKEPLILRGRALYARGENEKAIELFHQVITDYPDFPDAAMYMDLVERLERKKEQGNALFWAGNFPEAIASYTEALQVDPLNLATNSMILNSRAKCYNVERLWDMALQDTKRAIQINWSHVEARKTQARALEGKGSWDKALGEYMSIQELNPEDVTTTRELERVQLKLKERTKEAGVREDPDST